MASGTIDFLPEQWPLREAFLPSGVTVVTNEAYGGAMRAQIQGEGIEDGKIYQLVVTNEPMRRVIELVENPNQDA